MKARTAKAAIAAIILVPICGIVALTAGEKPKLRFYFNPNHNEWSVGRYSMSGCGLSLAEATEKEVTEYIRVGPMTLSYDRVIPRF